MDFVKKSKDDVDLKRDEEKIESPKRKSESPDNNNNKDKSSSSTNRDEKEDPNSKKHRSSIKRRSRSRSKSPRDSRRRRYRSHKSPESERHSSTSSRDKEKKRDSIRSERHRDNSPHSRSRSRSPRSSHSSSSRSSSRSSRRDRSEYRHSSRRSSRRRRSSPSSGSDSESNRSHSSSKSRSGWDSPSTTSTTSSTNGAATAISTAQAQALLVQQQQIALQQAALKAQKEREHSIACRIYVGSMPFDIGEAEIRAAFSPFGPIKNITLSRDPLTGKSKGFCFLEYLYAEAAKAALENMNNFILGGRYIKVGRPYNNMAGVMPVRPNPMGGLVSNPLHPPLMLGVTPPTHTPHVYQPPSIAPDNSKRIYVGSIHWDLSPADVKSVFEAFGPVTNCMLMPNPETGKHKGYGFIEFEKESSATEAIAQMDKFELGGRSLKVGRAISNASVSAPAPSTIATAVTAASAIANQINAKKQEESLSHEESLTISNPNKRYEIMQKLARGPDFKASRCIVLCNMVGPEEVDEELEGEVTQEASKFGVVEKVVIFQGKASDTDTTTAVKIFILFVSSKDSVKAKETFDGRYFGGRVIKSYFYPEDAFNTGDYTAKLEDS